MWYTPKTKLSCLDQSDLVWFVMKTRQDNDVAYHTSAVNAENCPDRLDREPTMTKTK